MLSPPIDGLIAPLAALIQQLSIREQLPQIEVAVGDTAAALVLRTLHNPSEQDCVRLREFEGQYNVHFFLQSGGLDSVRALSETPCELSYALPAAGLELEFGPTDFIQINAEANRAMVAAAAELLELDSQSRVLDLYCGLGNFSLALARRAHAVVGIEGDAALIARARANARRNGIANAQFFQADLSGAELSGEPWLQQRHTPCPARSAAYGRARHVGADRATRSPAPAVRVLSSRYAGPGSGNSGARARF